MRTFGVQLSLNVWFGAAFTMARDAPQGLNFKIGAFDNMDICSQYGHSKTGSVLICMYFPL
jgi:hypothetical protein